MDKHEKLFPNDFIVKKIMPDDMESLCYEHSMLRTHCPTQDIDCKDFLKSRNCIITLRSLNNRNIYGIIGARLTTMEEVGIDKLDFYCKPDQEVYSIDFMHFSTPGKFDVTGSYINANKIYIGLIRECLADKNDGFAVYKAYCPTGKSPEIHDALIESGFKVESYDSKSETFTYVKPPEMYLYIK